MSASIPDVTAPAVADADVRGPHAGASAPHAAEAAGGLTSRCRPATEILQRVGDKWTVLVVMVLWEGGVRRFSEIRREIPAISQRMLTLTLRGLERDGLVSRKVTPSIPPRVDYALTGLGRSLGESLRALGQWAVDNHPAIVEARGRYDGTAED